MVVEAKMLEYIWVFDSVLILDDGAEAPERALLVEAKMLEGIWMLKDVLVLDDPLAGKDVVMVEVDTSSCK